MKKEGVQTRKRKARSSDGVPSKSRRNNQHNSSNQHRHQQQAAQATASVDMSTQLQHSYIHVGSNGKQNFSQFNNLNV